MQGIIPGADGSRVQDKVCADSVEDPGHHEVGLVNTPIVCKEKDKYLGQICINGIDPLRQSKDSSYYPIELY